MEAASKKNMIFTSPKGGFEVLPYTAQNFAEYKQGILDIAKALPEIDLGVISSLSPGSADFSYIAIVDGKVAGFIICFKISQGILFVGNIAVHKRYKKRGIGNMLLLAAAEKAQSSNITIAETLVVMNSDLLRFFIDRGFREPEPTSLAHFLKTEVAVVIEKTSKKMRENLIERMQDFTPITVRTNL